jgi:hypothetical protein
MTDFIFMSILMIWMYTTGSFVTWFIMKDKINND